MLSDPEVLKLRSLNRTILLMLSLFAVCGCSQKNVPFQVYEPSSPPNSKGEALIYVHTMTENGSFNIQISSGDNRVIRLSPRMFTGLNDFCEYDYAYVPAPGLVRLEAERAENYQKRVDAEKEFEVQSGKTYYFAVINSIDQSNKKSRNYSVPYVKIQKVV
jgi:hypothetical protein